MSSVPIMVVSYLICLFILSLVIFITGIHAGLVFVLLMCNFCFSILMNNSTPVLLKKEEDDFYKNSFFADIGLVVLLLLISHQQALDDESYLTI
jgi:hypothetical protein